MSHARPGAVRHALAGIALVAVALLPDGAVAVSEYQVKAAFLLNFGKFVEWPTAALPERALDICVLGPDPFGAALDEVLAGRMVAGRTVNARRVGDVSAASGCAILFVSRATPTQVGDVVSSLRGAPVLLVGEQARFARQGGMINFIEVDQKIRFEINEAAAKRAGLRISSKLLKLATIVEGG